ncbi:sensor histidine kinase [Parvularcula dongshanensis]|uniref:histidine kinase n=1 Tax=Parvularcula dongshanensis TaxID=1173995 RepID=A0A840HZX7_9PROT|nr:ATP-binding protein [Parvularcula dongshanensis]MBB4658386.1 two-component system nitrogen regulation sensor histidine kinase NtrY [Parvularcula dongshanensis]
MASRQKLFLRRPGRLSNRTVLVLLALLASLVFATTAWVLAHLVDSVPTAVPVLFALFLVLVGVLGLLVGSRLLALYRAARAGSRGAKLHGRLVGVLSVVSIVPAVVAFVLSGAVLQSFAQNYFLERVQASNAVARDLANGYFAAQAQEAGVKLGGLAEDLVVLERFGGGPEASPVYFRSWLLGQAVLREFAGLTILGPDGRVVAAVSQMPGEPFDLPPISVLESMKEAGDGSFNVLDATTLDTYYATLRTEALGGATLIAYKSELPALSGQLLAVRDFRDEAAGVRRRLANLSVNFAVGYGLLLMILLLAAVYLGLLVAESVVDPVRRLATAAGRVSEGDLSSRVNLPPRRDELGDLGRVFDTMTEQLEAQRADLIAANEEQEQRRRFIETVLSGVPAGVLTVSGDGHVVFANPAAASILGMGRRTLQGTPLGSVAPELAPLLQRASGTHDGSLSGQIEAQRRGVTRILNVQIVAEGGEHDEAGSIVMLDDITALVGAQRSAAWGDVARRIAHEIKNPLTPIQLSAERIRRRYGKQIDQDDREVFDRCTDTIIRHVGDIGRMVNEFSAFARMPEPVMATENLGELIREATFPITVAFPTVRFVTELPEAPVLAACDGRLLSQAVGNLLKNAAEAVTEHAVDDPSVSVALLRLGGEAVIEVGDNGPGLPPEAAHRLTEPYMTTREKGTGLGLAIVRKATEDQGGRFEIDNAEGGGARARIVLPAQEETRGGAARERLEA